MDNENPTILNASDLPSRKRQAKVSHGVSGLLSSVAPTAEMNDVFSTGNVSSSFDNEDEDDIDGDDFNIDHIDEQEIYGMLSFLPFCNSRNHVPVVYYYPASISLLRQIPSSRSPISFFLFFCGMVDWLAISSWVFPAFRPC